MCAVLLHAFAEYVCWKVPLRESLHHVGLFAEVEIDVPGDVLDAAWDVFEPRY